MQPASLAGSHLPTLPRDCTLPRYGWPEAANVWLAATGAGGCCSDLSLQPASTGPLQRCYMPWPATLARRCWYLWARQLRTVWSIGDAFRPNFQGTHPPASAASHTESLEVLYPLRALPGRHVLYPLGMDIPGAEVPQRAGQSGSLRYGLLGHLYIDLLTLGRKV